MDAQVIAYLNVQTQRQAIDVGGWYPEKMGLAVAAVHSAGQTHTYTEETAHELAAVLGCADQISGYNLMGFDLRVLEPYCTIAPSKCLDLMVDLEAAAGRRLLLNAVYSGTFNEALPGNSLELVKAWKEGEVAKVVEGTMRTASTIQRLHEHGQEHGRVAYLDAAEGGVREVRVGW